MTLVHLWVTMFHVKFSEKSVGKVNPLRTSCMSAFSRFSLFWSYTNPKGNPHRNMANCSMGPGDFITLKETLIQIWLIVPWGRRILKLVWSLHETLIDMANCSMGPGGFKTDRTLNETLIDIWWIVPWGPGVLKLVWALNETLIEEWLMFPMGW